MPLEVVPVLGSWKPSLERLCCKKSVASLACGAHPRQCESFPPLRRSRSSQRQSPLPEPSHPSFAGRTRPVREDYDRCEYRRRACRRWVKSPHRLLADRITSLRESSQSHRIESCERERSPLVRASSPRRSSQLTEIIASCLCEKNLPTEPTHRNPYKWPYSPYRPDSSQHARCCSGVVASPPQGLKSNASLVFHRTSFCFWNFVATKGTVG